MRISVIMPVYLGDYPGAAPDREKKFLRAVKSFIDQTHEDKELVVISDGCERTNHLLTTRYKRELDRGVIQLIRMERHRPFTGSIRQGGIDMSTGIVLCNLDSDDILLPNHLANVNEVWRNDDKWCYFNYYRQLDAIKDAPFEHVIATPDTDGLCTANVAWRRDLDVTWQGCDGRQDNKAFNQQLIDMYPGRKIYGCGYIVKHAVILNATV